MGWMVRRRAFKLPGRGLSNFCAAPVPFLVPAATLPVQAVHALADGRRSTLYRHAGKKVGTAGIGHPVRRYRKSSEKFG